MPLTPPKLDDRDYRQLVDEGLRRVPRDAPEWTDHNAHDPGITLLELFAWLSEMQGYYLDQVREAAKLKFLRLLGLRLRGAQAARALMRFSFRDGESRQGPPVFLPRGTRLSDGERMFELEDSLEVSPARLTQVVTATRRGLRDQSSALAEGTSFYAFGPQASPGSRLYIGFDRAFLEGREICLALKLFEDYPVKRNPDSPGLQVDPPAEVFWQYLRQDKAWRPLEVRDGTRRLTRSGTLIFWGPGDQGAANLPPLGGRHFWLRAEVGKADYELPPRVESIHLNSVDALHQQTLCEARAFSSSGEPGQEFRCSDLWALQGACRVQIREDGAWRDWKERPLAESASEDLHWESELQERSLLIRFGDGRYGAIPPEGEDNIRLVCAAPGEQSSIRLGRGDGTPAQRLELPGTPVGGDVRLQVRQTAVSKIQTARLEDSRGRLLARFRRVLYTVVPEGIPFLVRLWIRPEQDLKDVRVAERFEGLFRVDGSGGDTFSDQVDFLAAGQVREPFYSLQSSRDRGRIEGALTFAADGEEHSFDLPAGDIQAGHFRWMDWRQVEDFDASTPQDRHFRLVEKGGAVEFGDGENGRALPASEFGDPNVRLIGLRTGGGRRGNVKRGTIDRLEPPPASDSAEGIPWHEYSRRLRIEQLEHGHGGADPETPEQARLRARKKLRRRQRAVTSGDFVDLALATPGLRVARAHALPVHAPVPGSEEDELKQEESSVTVVAVPFSESERPRPSKGFLKTVERHLNQRRLITTKVHVIPPLYVRISVDARLRLRTGYLGREVCDGIVERLNAFFHPLRGGEMGGGWPFGRTVHRSKLFQLIGEAEGVDCVTRLDLSGVGEGEWHDPSGDVHLPPQGLTVAGRHRIEIESGESA